MIKKVEINGFRGFSSNQVLECAIPKNKTPGSGLTIIVGANNSGKTTISEAIRYINGDVDSIAISKDKRNKETDYRVQLVFEYENGTRFGIKTVDDGGSKVKLLDNNVSVGTLKQPYIVPSRRNIQFEFGGQYNNGDFNSRNDYMINSALNYHSRGSQLSNFESRIFEWYNKREGFNKILFRILEDDIEWTIDTNNNGNHYISFNNGEHTLEGVGDGIWGIFTLVDALFDSEPGNTIIIDEPELSVHPQIQKNIMNEFMSYSADRQIIITTHSPYFMSWKAVANGGRLIRVSKIDGESRVFHLDNSIIEGNGGLTSKTHPHTFGINANETFFLKDKVILVEGQEDIICFENILLSIDKDINNYSFYGWGVSGAGNMELIASILQSLGFEKVVIILDGDEIGIEKSKDCKEKFPSYRVFNIPTSDMRDKTKYKKNDDGQVCEYHIEGICDKHYSVKADFEVKNKKIINDIFTEIDQYFCN